MYFIVFGIFTFLSAYHLRFGECATPRFTSEPNNPTYADDGSSFTFNWNFIPDGLTVDKVEWSYISGSTNILIARKPLTGNLLVSNTYTGRVSALETGTLTLSSIQESDSGTYECRVSFTTIDPDRIISQSGFIVVVKPRITRRTTAAEVKLQEGQSQTLLCTADGNPQPVYTWFRDSTRVQDGTSPSSDYTITAATRQDAGTYRCVASVSGGQLGPYPAEYSVRVTVEFRPEVDSLSPNRTENDGNDVIFICRAVGVPPVVSYKWFDNSGNEISDNQKFLITSFDNSKSELRIRNILSSDAGQYTCSGSNSLGDGKGKSVFLTVNYAPQQVTVSPNAPVVKETESITLTCQADGFPTPSYSWKFNGNILSGADRNTLTFAPAEVKNAGNYTCRAQNFRGSKETEIVLNVQYQPKTTTFTTGTPNNAVLEGDKATLSCHADGFPPPAYTIKRNDQVVLPSAAIGVYEINNIQVAEESVTYSCEPSNFLGDGPPASLTVTVLVRPSFPNGQNPLPQDKQIKTEGDNITFSCSVDAKPFATILWLLNGENITEMSPYDIQVTYLAAPGKPKIRRTESHLKINGLTWRQHGNFSCFGVNEAGNVSETTELEVKYRPVVQTIEAGPQNLTVSKGGAASFDCTAIGNPPTEEYIWQFKGVNISGSGCTGCRSSRFFKSNVSQDDAGWYSCTGRNTLGFGPPAGAFLFIKHKPKINDFDPDQYIVNETNPVTMVCRAEGVPPPMITWLKSGVVVGSGQQLQISKTPESAHGIYTCQARNELGNDTREIQLTVQTRPTILTSTPLATNIATAAGETTDVSCTVKGTPQPTLSWEDEKRNTLTPSDANVDIITHGTGIIVMQVVVDTIGETFYCVAVNLLGRSEQKYVMRARGKPDPPENLKVTGIQVDDAATVAVNVSWTPGYSGGYDQEFVIQYRKQNRALFENIAVDRQAGSVYIVEGLDPLTDYVFRVYAKNVLGESEATSLAQVKTPASSGRFGAVEATRVESGTSIVVTWKIEEENVTTVDLEFREAGGIWAVVPGARDLDPTRTDFKVLNLKADKMYQFRVRMKKEGESEPVYLYSREVAPVPIPGKQEDDGFKTEWIIAIIAGAAGFLLILIVILCLCCFKRRKKHQGPSRVEMSQTSSYAAGGPNAVDNRRSYGVESVEDDPFIEAHFASVASMTSDGKKKKTDSGVNLGYMSQDSFQPEMLLNPGSRLPRNGRMSQSTGQLDVDSGYPARGPQRDFNTLPPYHEPPSFEEAMRQSGRKPKTRKSTGDLSNQPHHNRGGPGPARRPGRRPRQSQSQSGDEPTDSSDAEPRYAPHRTAPPPPRFRQVEPSDGSGYVTVDRQAPLTGPMVLRQGSPTGSGHQNAPFDPSIPYAVPQKKHKPKPRREEPNGAAVGPPPQYTSDDMSPDEPNHYPSFRPRQPPEDLVLDDPSNLQANEGPPDLPPPMAMLPGNRGMPNSYYDYGDGLPEPPAFLHDAMYSPDETEPRFAAPYHSSPGRQRKPYINIHGQLVRPESPPSDAFRRPESLRSSRNRLSPEPEMPAGNWQPRGSESDEEVPPETNYVSYLV